MFELFSVKDDIEELILQGVDSTKISEAAVRSGMTTIAQDAYLKVIDRVTMDAEAARAAARKEIRAMSGCVTVPRVCVKDGGNAVAAYLMIATDQIARARRIQVILTVVMCVYCRPARPHR